MPDATTPMDVGAVWGKGKGQGGGKGGKNKNGKGQDRKASIRCWVCDKLGHYGKECRSGGGGFGKMMVTNPGPRTAGTKERARIEERTRKANQTIPRTAGTVARTRAER